MIIRKIQREAVIRFSEKLVFLLFTDRYLYKSVVMILASLRLRQMYVVETVVSGEIGVHGSVLKVF